MSSKKISVINRVKEITDKVYGTYTSAEWRPKPFERTSPRYLWTDAYGVINYLSLFAETQQAQFLEQAEILIASVHDTLGKTRDGSHRLPNASDDHPTLGGLRIGKPKDEGQGMDQDGQYYHYLTKWMFALNRASLVTGKSIYNEWALELAKAVHKRFVHSGRMYWKMSIDLRTPLTPSEGGLDPYDGLTMYRVLQNTGGSVSLKDEIDEMQNMVNHRVDEYRTSDSLDAGEALWLAHFFPNDSYSKTLYIRASKCVENLWKTGEFTGNARYRLAFREFGTTIGVQMHSSLTPVWADRVEDMHRFWYDNLYSRDCDITPVMYCTSLLPTKCRAK